MQKRLSFWKITALTLGVWVAIIWIVQARQGIDPAAGGVRQPLQQVCNDTRADLRIERIQVNHRGIGQPFDVRVDIRNGSTGNEGLADTWSYLYVDRAPEGAPNVQAFAQTSVLTDTISANFTVTGGYATVGWHTVSVIIDATDVITDEGCNGEANNQGAMSFEIQGVQPPTPTSTPFPPPQIYLFEPEQATIGRGDPVTLRWQVTGQSVSVILDGETVPMQASLVKYPTESYVYTLRAENPGGSVQKTSQITVVDPTVTPTPTETPCNYATIHEFGASPASVIRGQKTTLFWDVAGATQVFLNGEPVPEVSSREFKIDRTTTFTLVARNACGDVEENLIVQAAYATATPTSTPTLTPTPTWTATPTPTRLATSTPLPTPTRNVLPTHTPDPSTAGTQTATPTMTSTSSAFDSPIGTPTGTVEPPAGTITATASITATWTPTSTATLSPTWTVAVSPTATDTVTPTAAPTEIETTPTVDLSGPVTGGTPTQTPDTAPSGPTPAPTALPPAGTIRMYLCPLAVLLLFAIGVVILSIVVPRIQEKQQDLDDFGYSAALYGVAAGASGETGPQQDADPPGGPALAARGPANRPPGDSLLEDDLPIEDVSFEPNGPLLDDEQPLPDISFDPLIEDLGPSRRQEPERGPSA